MTQKIILIVVGCAVVAGGIFAAVSFEHQNTPNNQPTPTDSTGSTTTVTTATRGAGDSTNQQKTFTDETNVTYCSPGGVPQKLDISFPTDGSAGPWPLVMFVHGGSWSTGTKEMVLQGPFFTQSQSLRSNGFVYVSVDYRLSPAYKFPVQIEDVKCAIRFLRANAATYNIDPKRISLMGSSAGSHLAMLAALAGPSAGWDVGEYLNESSVGIKAVVDNWGPADLSQPDFIAIQKTLFASVFGTDSPAALKIVSPTTYITSNAPPFFIVHGNKDEVVPVDQAQEMYADLIAVGVHATLLIVQNAGHGLGASSPNVPINPSLSDVLSQATNFLVQYGK